MLEALCEMIIPVEAYSNLQNRICSEKKDKLTQKVMIQRRKKCRGDLFWPIFERCTCKTDRVSKNRFRI